jgi:hypothetical protein
MAPRSVGTRPTHGVQLWKLSYVRKGLDG